MNKIEIVKKVTTIVVGLGASKISATIIKNNVATENVIDKVTVTAGSVVIGMMVSDVTKKYTSDKIDELADSLREAKNKLNEAKLEKQASTNS